MEKKRGRSIMRAIKYLAEGFFPLLFWVSAAFGFDTPDVAILTILCALLHELGHISAILITKRRFRIRSHVSGFRIQENSLSYKDQIFILSAGPLSNLTAFALTLPFGNAMRGYIALVGYLNIITALSNLMLIEGYDGYAIIKLILERYECGRLVKILNGFSFAFSIILLFLSLYLLYRFNSGYWLFGLFFVIILTKINGNL